MLLSLFSLPILRLSLSLFFELLLLLLLLLNLPLRAKRLSDGHLTKVYSMDWGGAASGDGWLLAAGGHGGRVAVFGGAGGEKTRDTP